MPYKFICSTRFLASSLSNLINNLTEGIHKIKCNDCNCYLEDESVKDFLIKDNAHLAIKIIQTKLMNKSKRDPRTHLSFLIMTQWFYFSCKKGSLSL